MVYYLFDNTGKNLDIYRYAHIYCHTHLKKYSALLIWQFTKNFMQYNAAAENFGKSSG